MLDNGEAAALTFNCMHLANADKVSLVARNESAVARDYTVYFDSVVYSMYIILYMPTYNKIK